MACSGPWLFSMLSAFCLDKSIDYLENSNIRFLAKIEGNFFQNFFMFYLILGDVKMGEGENLMWNWGGRDG